MALLALAVSVCLAQRSWIVTEDGTPLATTPQIKGECTIVNIFGNGVLVVLWNSHSAALNAHSADLNTPPGVGRPLHKGQDSCEVIINAQGYRRTTATLTPDSTVVLKRIGISEGSGVSLTVLKAPQPARSQYEQGEQAMARKKWAEAQGHFEQAVALFPEYAMAWSELGAALQREDKPDEAEKALKRAIEVEPRYIKPYVQLAGLELTRHRYEESIAAARRAFKLNPIEFPELYCYHAQASLKLNRLDDAETSARKAIENDSEHTVPQAECVLGAVLAAKSDKAGAVEHLKLYLKHNKRGEYAEAAKKLLAELK